MKFLYPFLVFFIAILFFIYKSWRSDQINNQNCYYQSFSGIIQNKYINYNSHASKILIIKHNSKISDVLLNSRMLDLWEMASTNDSVIKRSNSYIFRLIKIKDRDTLIEDFEYKPR